jgi:hypothetical protein
MITTRAYALSMIILTLFAVTAVMITAHHTPATTNTTTTTPVVRTQDDVTSYNDGFMDGKGECK